MGDPTYVELTVLTRQAEAAEALFNEEPEDTTEDGEFTRFGFEEVNYGKLGFLAALQDAGIAYDSAWIKGDNYSAGTVSLRFTEAGESVEKEVYVLIEQAPILDDLKKILDDPIALRACIADWIEETLILPWDNQEEYGKRYRARQLIAP